MKPICPLSRDAGSRVPARTLRSLVLPERLPKGAAGAPWFFCPGPDCQVVYFQENGTTLKKSDLRVRVGSKETASPHPICYCFNHTAESIQEELEATGQSTVLAAIKEKIQTGACACEEKNPKGTCCLGDISRAVQAARKRLHLQSGKAAGQDLPAKDPPPNEAPPGGCAGHSPLKVSHRRHRWFLGGSLVAALLSSACCWLPLLLLAFGVSAAGVSTAFAAVRPIFLTLAGLLLAAGFYLAYFRKPVCRPGSACASVPRRQRMTRIMLWVCAGMVALVALFPNYVATLLDSAPAKNAPLSTPTGPTRIFAIRGMSCEACSLAIKRELEALPGVRKATVSFQKKQAQVQLSPKQAPTQETLLAAIARAGYQATPTSPSKR